jgi:hypothetical protein
MVGVVLNQTVVLIHWPERGKLDHLSPYLQDDENGTFSWNNKMHSLSFLGDLNALSFRN